MKSSARMLKYQLLPSAKVVLLAYVFDVSIVVPGFAAPCVQEKLYPLTPIPEPSDGTAQSTSIVLSDDDVLGVCELLDGAGMEGPFESM